MRLDLLELLGAEYIIEHCYKEVERHNERRIYMVYVTDMLKAGVESQGVEVNSRFIDILDKYENKEPVAEKTGDEIALEVIEKLGLKVKTNDTV